MIAKNLFIIHRKTLGFKWDVTSEKERWKKLSIHIAFLNARLGEIPLAAIMTDNELLHVHFPKKCPSIHC